MTYKEEMIALSRTQKGICEQPLGSNDGPKVREYQSVTGAYHQPWCNSYCAWLVKMVGATKVLRTADTWAMQEWAKDNRLIEKEPMPGDFFLVMSQDYDYKKPEHIGLVIGVMGDKFMANEGNIGDCVIEQTRNWKTEKYEFIRWNRLYVRDESEFETAKWYLNKSGMSFVFDTGEKITVVANVEGTNQVKIRRYKPS